MSRNFYSEINLHFVWHTSQSAPFLTESVEPVAHRMLRQRILAFDGLILHEIGGTETHVHIAVTVPPTLAPSDFIGNIKGGSSHDVNQEFALRGKVLEWQTGYGVVSFGTKDLEWVRAYIRDQRAHHQRKSAVDRLERLTHD